MHKYPHVKTLTNEKDKSEYMYSASKQKHVASTSAQVSWSLITTHSEY